MISNSSPLINLAIIGRLSSDARDIAAFYALRKTGVVGILMRAKLQGHIASLREELEKLRTSAGFWIANELCQQALVAVGEQDASN